MDIFEQALNVNGGNKIAAAVDIARGTMAHDPRDPLRMGYGLGAALIGVSEIYDLNVRQTAVVAERLVRPLLESATAFSEGVNVGRLPDADRRALDVLRNALENFGVAR